MLELYKNIKLRRTELKLSQEELANRVGYRDRSSIAKIESGDVDLPQSKIVEFAKALNTTPGALMGWADDNNQNDKYEIKTIAAHHDDYEFTEEELTEIEQFKEFVRMRKRQKEEDNKR